MIILSTARWEDRVWRLLYEAFTNCIENEDCGWVSSSGSYTLCGTLLHMEQTGKIAPIVRTEIVERYIFPFLPKGSIFLFNVGTKDNCLQRADFCKQRANYARETERESRNRGRKDRRR